jgi:excinuclease ABC subunit C
MTKQLKTKLADLPNSPGVYFFKNTHGEVIYIGKAANLKNRVRQYFQASRWRDPKTDVLIAEIVNLDWLVTSSEAEALFLEAELVKRYLPKYNILLRDDKSNVYIRINLPDQAPSVTLTRRPLDDGAKYWGPFLQAGPINKALRALRKAFPYSTHRTLPSRACLDYHLGLCPGPETSDYNRQTYLDNLKKLVLFIEGKSPKVVKALQNEMQLAAKQQDFELAARLRNQLHSIKALQAQIIFGDSENLDLSKDYALADLTELLGLKTIPRRIEGYDISHWQGSDSVASMVVFKNGVPAKPDYRKFKLRLIGSDDYAHLSETILRRLQPKNIQAWGLPDLLIIDGGKGQLSAVLAAMQKLNQTLPAIGLAKRFEEIIIPQKLTHTTLNEAVLKRLKGVVNEKNDNFTVINLPVSSHIIKLLQRIRDESHRFATTYQLSIKLKRQSTSQLDAIPGIGPATKKKLIRHFGSLKAISGASIHDLASIVGQHRAELIRQHFSNTHY